ncbi:hypothetical protein AB0D04_34925 [Streptomyces sp. NPDC048483]|uniref:hypothetical protein n=1 Tax=Streptomyces sp. NPDC048483 TaxID=3154927 RepID=UPI00343B1F3E
MSLGDTAAHAVHVYVLSERGNAEPPFRGLPVPVLETSAGPVPAWSRLLASAGGTVQLPLLHAPAGRAAAPVGGDGTESVRRIAPDQQHKRELVRTRLESRREIDLTRLRSRTYQGFLDLGTLLAEDFPGHAP